MDHLNSAYPAPPAHCTNVAGACVHECINVPVNNETSAVTLTLRKFNEQGKHAQHCCHSRSRILFNYNLSLPHSLIFPQLSSISVSLYL